LTNQYFPLKGLLKKQRLARAELRSGHNKTEHTDMPFIQDPRRRSWEQIAEDLRNLQGIVDLYKGRFEAAGRKDTADDLERCILLLIGAEGIAKTIDLEDRGGRLTN
jgi:hypothetical protein